MTGSGGNGTLLTENLIPVVFPSDTNRVVRKLQFSEQLPYRTAKYAVLGITSVLLAAQKPHNIKNAHAQQYRYPYKECDNLQHAV